jgi:hypothetical protein
MLFLQLCVLSACALCRAGLIVMEAFMGCGPEAVGDSFGDPLGDPVATEETFTSPPDHRIVGYAGTITDEHVARMRFYTASFDGQR